MFRKLLLFTKYELLKPLFDGSPVMAAVWNIRKYYHVLCNDKLGKGLKYDQLTIDIIRDLPRNSNCIDVGAHKGSILKAIVEAHPDGRHLAIEPIRYLAEALQERFPSVDVLNIALGEREGSSIFFHMKSAPELSGLQRRPALDGYEHRAERLSVKVRRIDSIIAENPFRVAFIKLDVEGAEFLVLKGARETILRDRPVIIFEFERAGGEAYGVVPREVFEYLTNVLRLGVYTLNNWTSGRKSRLTLEELEALYRSEEEFYFIAAPLAE